MEKKQAKVGDQVRKAVRECGLSLGALSRASGVHISALSRFLSRERGLSMMALDRLGLVLHLRIVMAGKAKEGR